MISKKPTLDAVIGSLYESVLNPNGLQDALKLCALYIGANDALIMSFDKEDERPIDAVIAGLSHSFDEIDDYVNYYSKIDPRAHINKAPLKEWLFCHDINSQHYVDHNEFYQDYLLPCNVRYLMVAGAYEDNELFKTFGLIRNVGQNPFDQTNISAANQLFDHLQRTLRLHYQTQKLQTKIELGTIAVDNCKSSMIIVNARGGILHLNTSADKLLNDPDFDLCYKDGYLTARLSTHCHQLNSLISTATKKQAVGGQMQVSGVKNRQVFVTPVVASSIFAKDWQTPLALILLNKTGKPPSQLEAISKLLHFTKAEGRVASALMAGQSLEEYASAANVTLNTVRSQLKALFQKTGTKRQAELVALLNNTHVFL